MTDRCVITIGNFDGVHLGHRAMLRRAHDLGTQHGVPLKVLTFEPHPATVLRPGSDNPRLSTSTEKLALLREAGFQFLLRPQPGR